MGTINFVETIGAFILAGAMIVLFWNIAASLLRGRAAADNPWDAWTLEWAATSPPPAFNFRPGALPPIRSSRPRWDLEHAVQQAEWVVILSIVYLWALVQ